MKQSIVTAGDKIITAYKPAGPRVFYMQYIFVLSGSLAGTIYGVYHPQFLSAEAMMNGMISRSAFLNLLYAFYPFIIALFLATSVIGFYLFPVILFSRGFILSLQASLLLDAQALLTKALVSVVPFALLSLSSLFLIGNGVLLSSWRLYHRQNDDFSDPVPVFQAFVLTLLAALSRIYIPALIH